MRLIIRDIRKKYNDLDIIDDVSYTFEAGRVYGITGGEGAGKEAHGHQRFPAPAVG